MTEEKGSDVPRGLDASGGTVSIGENLGPWQRLHNFLNRLGGRKSVEGQFPAVATRDPNSVQSFEPPYPTSIGKGVGGENKK